jgi:hypothetical protein
MWIRAAATQAETYQTGLISLKYEMRFGFGDASAN